mgnify:FL=1
MTSSGHRQDIVRTSSLLFGDVLTSQIFKECQNIAMLLPCGILIISRYFYDVKTSQSFRKLSGTFLENLVHFLILFKTFVT